MIANTDIERGAVTATKLSKNLRLPLTNITAGESGQVLVGQTNGDPAYKSVTGAITIDSDGLTEMAATTDSVSEGDNNLYYTDERVDARIRAIRNQSDQLATPKEPGFMPARDKVKLDATPTGSSAIRKFSVTIAWGTDAANVSFAGSGDSEVATITHSLKTQAVVASIQDSGNLFMDLGYFPFDITANSATTIEVSIEDGSTAPSAGTNYLVTIIG